MGKKSAKVDVADGGVPSNPWCGSLLPNEFNELQDIWDDMSKCQKGTVMMTILGTLLVVLYSGGNYVINTLHLRESSDPLWWVIVNELTVLALAGSVLMGFAHVSSSMRPTLMRCCSPTVADGFTSVVSLVVGFGVFAVFGHFFWRNGFLGTLALGAATQVVLDGYSFAERRLGSSKAPGKGALAEDDKLTQGSWEPRADKLRGE